MTESYLKNMFARLIAERERLEPIRQQIINCDTDIRDTIDQYALFLKQNLLVVYGAYVQEQGGACLHSVWRTLKEAENKSYELTFGNNIPTHLIEKSLDPKTIRDKELLKEMAARELDLSIEKADE